MSTIPKDPIALRRDCPAVAIPAGRATTLPKGTQVTVTQSLGGSFTVTCPGGLFQIAGPHADALGLDAPPPAAGPAPAAGFRLDENAIWEALKTCFDPEIPVNIVDLGLIYDMKLSDAPRGGQRVDVKMTLTAAGCGMGPSIAADAQRKLVALPGVAEANVDIVWEPRWNPAMISAEGRKKLGMD
jgi:probable FeS assembly SUF system protein SufT